MIIFSVLAIGLLVHYVFNTTCISHGCTYTNQLGVEFTGSCEEIKKIIEADNDNNPYVGIIRPDEDYEIMWNTTPNFSVNPDLELNNTR